MRAGGKVLVALAATLVLATAWAGQARAQSFSRLEPGQQAVTLETGLEGAVATSVGYAAGLRVEALDRTVMPFVQGTLMTAHPDLGDYAARAGAQTSLLRAGWFDLSAQLGFGVAGTDDSIHRATALRADAVLLAGHYGRSWFLVGEGGYQHAFLTYIKNSDYYRSFFPGARDGWYGDTAGTFHAGAKGGAKLGGVELVLRAGVTKSERFNNLALPFYATLGASYRF
jgi:hypothetical protein